MKNIAIDDVTITIWDNGLKYTTQNGESFNFPMSEVDRKPIDGIEFNEKCDLTMQIDDEYFELMKSKYGAREID